MSADRRASCPSCARSPAKPAATCVSKSVRTAVPETRRRSATRWRPARRIRLPPRRRRLGGPVAVLGVVLARLVLGVAVALALDADAEDHVQQPDRHTGGDDRDAALPAGLAAAARDDRDDAGDDDGDG